jgi:hypothetical protein
MIPLWNGTKQMLRCKNEEAEDLEREEQTQSQEETKSEFLRCNERYIYEKIACT